jgi:coenzyme F420 hydrogenase subunit beta
MKVKKNIPDNIKNAIDSNLCTGCGTCAGVCPRNTLEMVMTPEGTYIPQVAVDNCQACDLCNSVCPVDKENLKELNQFIFNKMPDNMLIGNFLDCYTGYSTDSDIRWNSTSGGIITTLLIYLLRNELIDGALLTRTSRDDPLRAEPFIARTEDDILSAMGSKYIPVALNQLLDRVLFEDGKFAVVGLPCHIQGIRRAELKTGRLREKIVYHFGLTCSRTMTCRGVEYILRKMGVSTNDVTELKYRGEGWPGHIKVLLKGGENKKLSNQRSLWSEIFGGYFFAPFCCTLCYDHLNEFADISFADAWISRIVKQDKKGTSIIITRTLAGAKLVDHAVDAGKIQVSSVYYKEVLQSQLWPLLFKKRNLKARMKLLKMFRKPVTRSLDGNIRAFLKPTFWDYIVSPIPYVNIRISRGKWLSKILQRTPLGIIRRYRGWFKGLLMLNAVEAIEHLEESDNSNGDGPKIVITNSHANNRGDEAAQRSMINCLSVSMPDAKFTVLTIDPNGLHLQKGVKILRTFSATKTMGFIIIVLWAVFRALGLRLPAFYSPKLSALRQMGDADIIISAPGGPYFGDLYASHEIREHLFHIFLAKIMRKPVMIYAPSMGPFNSRKRNILRRYLLNKVEIISLRDSISKDYLDSLKLTRPLVYVTADSAFQDTINVERDKLESIMLDEKIVDRQNESPNRRPLVGITPTGPKWNFRDSANPQEDQTRYNRIIANTMDYLVDKFDARIVFFPQLYGKSDDVPLINQIVKLVRSKHDVRVLSNKWDSEIQQAVISEMDFVIGNRYHSVIFALKAEIPTICLAYEHKSLGIMQAAKLEKYVINVADLTYELLIEKIDHAWSRREEMRSVLRAQMPTIRKLSLMNTSFATALVELASRGSIKKEVLEKEISRTKDNVATIWETSHYQSEILKRYY